MKRLLLFCLFIPLLTASFSPAQAADGEKDKNEHVVFDPVYFDDLEYRMIGPYRGGRSTAVTGIAGKPDTYFMGTTGGGVWKTTNSGQDWKNISDDHFDVASIGGIDVANSDPNVIYVGTGSACLRGNIQTGRGVYKSTDGGRSWSFTGLENAGLIGKVAVHPEDADIAYIAAVGQPFGNNKQRGVFRTTDGGDTWEKVLYISDSTGVVDLSINPKNPREIYAGLWTARRKPWTMISGSKEGGIYKSTDGGDNWKRLKGGLPQGIVGKTSLAISPVKPERVWALVEAPEPKGGLYRSDDHGKTWKQVNNSRKHLRRAWYYTHIYADPQDEHTVYSLNEGFLKSVDGGKTFERYGVPHGDVHDLWVNPKNPDRMVVANDGGAQVSLDGAETWSTYMNQPTAEMYSVTVDNEFPYRVYGPQQDNSTIRIPAWTEYTIHPKSNWTNIGGGETGPIALHPDRPWLIYAGNLGGIITRYNEKTAAYQNITVYPQLQLGKAPKNLRERFPWNAPIVVSPHDPGVVYHASHRIWRSTDRGLSWERISGDLTTDTPEHQDYAGEPITRDNTGVEVFNTLSSLRVSPHAPETLWAGTDDGRVWITRDSGSNWNEITPEDLPEYGTVQRIEVSPHEEGKAYIAVHRYRLDDWQPYIYRTTDYGESWTRIADGTSGIPGDSPTWVVREDPKREGLLYAGTEFGIYVSFNDGKDWQSLQQNLPVTRIPDLKVHDNDLAVATHGRSFWIMDDLSPLRQLTDQVANSNMHLHSPEAAYLVNARSGGNSERRRPEGPEGGAAFDYIFTENPDTTVTLQVLNSDGEVLRSYTSNSKKSKENKQPVLPVDSTHNRFHWNLQTEPVDKVDDAFPVLSFGNARVVPGNYQVRLKVKGGPSQTRSFEVRKDPRLKGVRQKDFTERYDLATAIQDSLNSIYDAIRTLRSVREQVNSVASNAKEAGHDFSETQHLADTITEKLSDIEGELMQVKIQGRADELNYPPQLVNQYHYLHAYVNFAVPPTEGAYERYSDLNDQWSALRKRLHNLLNTEVAQFNQRMDELGEPVFVPKTIGK